MRTLKDKICDRLILVSGYVKYPKALKLVDILPRYISKTQAAYLCSLAKGKVLDIGSGNGLSTAVMATAGASVLSFEWFKGIWGVTGEDKGFHDGEFPSTREAFKEATNGLDVTLYEGNCLKTIPKLIADGTLTEFSLAFLDVDLYKTTKEIVRNLIGIMSSESKLLIHDYPCSGIVKAVKELTVEYPLKIVREYPILTLELLSDKNDR